MKGKGLPSDQIRSYFYWEWRPILAIAISGFCYNLGLLANPWFEGKLAGCLVSILAETSSFYSMSKLVFWYVLVNITVQSARYIKRFYVRRFANNVRSRMKKNLYRNLLQKSRHALEQEGMGNMLIKAISDVDDCAEGMRKFTTEIFDTGVTLICYTLMLLWYDWRLALLSLLFPPISYILAEKMKQPVQRTGAISKQEAGSLSAATLDRISNATLYRVFGCEDRQNQRYENHLSSYETAAVQANLWLNALPPLYHIICMAGTLFILYFGTQNVMGNGWSSWDIASFTTFLACYTKLSIKASKASKLFNAVHKAQISWNRIRPLMFSASEAAMPIPAKSSTLTVENLSVSYGSDPPIFQNLSFHAEPGQILGITGPIACGKSSLGKAFLLEQPYSGSIRFGDIELSSISKAVRCGIVGYLGHDPELFSDSIRNNVLLGDNADLWKYLRLVCMDKEVNTMTAHENTMIGTGGIRLSGGQAQRLALARTLCHATPLLILDDPFSALDYATESQIFMHLKTEFPSSIILLISHRLRLFPQMDQIIWLNQGHAEVGTHTTLMEQNPLYAELFYDQEGRGSHEI